MFGSSQLITIAVVGVVAAGALTFAYMQGQSSTGAKLGKNFERALMREREVAIRREVNLWTQIGDERRARLELIETVQRIDQLSEDARQKMLAALARERARSKAALETAMANITELKNAASESAQNWKRGVIPDDITCGVFNAKGCGEPAYPATGADSDDGVEVRDAAPAAPAPT